MDLMLNKNSHITYALITMKTEKNNQDERDTWQNGGQKDEARRVHPGHEQQAEPPIRGVDPRRNRTQGYLECYVSNHFARSEQVSDVAAAAAVAFLLFLPG